MLGAGILDPTKVTRLARQNSVSVAGLQGGSDTAAMGGDPACQQDRGNTDLRQSLRAAVA